MGRLFVILALIAAFVIWRRWKKLNTQKDKREFVYKGLVFGLVAIIIGLAAFGRIDVLGAVFASLLLCIKFIIAFAIRNFPWIARIYGATDGFGLAKKRRIKTPWLDMKIDFVTKQLGGMVIQGHFAERDLDELSREELGQLRSECSGDQKSCYFLQAYINQRFRQTDQASSNQGSMTKEEALEILGLEGSPDTKEIKMAHKKLMQKLHPDRGGNDFLASLINRARDRLEEDNN